MKKNRTYLFVGIFFMLGGVALLLANSSPAMPLRITIVSNESLGKDVYDTYCVACHGEKGVGNGPDAYMMKIKPTDFRDGVYEFKSTVGASLPTKNDIVRTLELGVRTTAMLPQLQLNYREMEAVAGYVMHFSSKFRKEKPGGLVPIPLAPKETASMLRDGKKLFESSCSTCHGTNGEGNGPIANTLKDYRGGPIRPANLTERPLMRSNTPREMYRTIG